MTPIGIDLGTTNTVAAWVDASGEPRVLYGNDGNALLPSTIYFETPNVVQVGQDPFLNPGMRAENLALQSKRWVGRPRSFLFHGREYSAVELSSLILRKVVARARERLNDDIGPVTIAVPAHYDVAQRAAIHQVALLAGVELHAIVSEPVAATLAFALPQSGSLYQGLGDGAPTLVIDMGGGTLDISVVTCTTDIIDVPVVYGDGHLGGMDFDRVIYYHLCHHILDETGIDPADIPEFRFRLLDLARWAKESLTYNTEVTIPVPDTWLEGRECAPLDLTREQAETLWEGLLERAGTLLEQALDAAAAQGIGITRAVFSGGGSAVPAFRERMLERLGPVVAHHDPLLGPDEAVAVGTALYGKLTMPGKKATEPVRFPTLHEHLPYDLGVADDVGHLVVVVARGQRLPAKGEHVFTTVEDRQSQVVFRIVRRDADGRVTLLGELRLDGLPPVPQGEPDLHMRFDVDAQGALSISAWEGERMPVKLHVAFSGDLTALRPARRGQKLIVL
ncbi:MAG: Hsp70 family protein [Nitrospirota bacterium]|nr:Hsp70 family protein [Nitrospirota bacterium]